MLICEEKMNYNFKKLAEKLPRENKERLKSLYESAEFVIKEIDYTVCDMKEAKTKYDKEKFLARLFQLNTLLQNLEFAMQGEWGIEKNSNYHTWWLKPRNCMCPQLDNRDPAYFGGGKIITNDCPVHGFLLRKEGRIDITVT